MVLKKSAVVEGGNAKSNDIDSMIQDEINSKSAAAVVKKPSVYDSLKPTFTKSN